MDRRLRDLEQAALRDVSQWPAYQKALERAGLRKLMSCGKSSCPDGIYFKFQVNTFVPVGETSPLLGPVGTFGVRVDHATCVHSARLRWKAGDGVTRFIPGPALLAGPMICCCCEKITGEWWTPMPLGHVEYYKAVFRAHRVSCNWCRGVSENTGTLPRPAYAACANGEEILYRRNLSAGEYGRPKDPDHAG